MAENLDVRENQMVEITAAFLRCLDSAGNSGVTSMASLLRQNLIISGRGTTGTDCINDEPGVYRVVPNLKNLPSGVKGEDYAIYIVLVVDNVIRATVLYDDTNLTLYIGVKWGSFRGWRSIKLT